MLPPFVTVNVTGAGRNGRFRQLDRPLGQLGADGGRVAARSRHGRDEGAGKQEPADVADQRQSVSGSYLRSSC